MSRVLRVELRRSAAAGALLALLVAGAVLLYTAPQRWSAGWMPLAMIQREYLVLLWPLALAAGAWQARREHRSRVAELFASTARPRAQRILPILGAMGVAVGCGYLAVAAVAVPRIIDTASYLPGSVFTVVAVGGLAMIAAAWLGLAVGRFVPSVVTAPVLAVAGIALLLVIPAAMRRTGTEWLAMVLSPMYGMGQYTDYQTVTGRVSLAQAIWLTALAGAAVVLLASGSWRSRVAALLPAALGVALATVVAPRGDAFVAHPIDPVAQEHVCAQGSPRVCVSRVHAGLLPEVTPLARQALSMLAKLPDPPTAAHEDTTTYHPDTSPPRRADTVLIPVQVDKHGRLAGKSEVIPRMLDAGGANMRGCEGRQPSTPVARAVGYWLLGRVPEPGHSLEPAEINAEAVRWWRALRRLPEREAVARVAEVRRAALACEELTDLPAGSRR
ncbi:hypothetical protein QTQ03_11810 [Micromonospora sp. WMMA1363]|uniref:hypothetical protein n=1 Tax=Micromonospora sp. WMMA1363 TaxID=3053985 RepID=UPI00259C82FE|nr:hypothetical protein [Micromonospora sp. WMMA1363]MDM4720227.1 hypothetical protein [Micromonospora sp. WMMA1363]